MRKWFTPMFVNRFGASVTFKEGKMIPEFNDRYDWALGKTTRGFYIRSLGVIYRGIKSKGRDFQFMNEEEKKDCFSYHFFMASDPLFALQRLQQGIKLCRLEEPDLNLGTI